MHSKKTIVAKQNEEALSVESVESAALSAMAACLLDAWVAR